MNLGNLLPTTMVGSGLRLSEVAGCDVHDLDLKKCCVRVIRKGNKEQSRTENP